MSPPEHQATAPGGSAAATTAALAASLCSVIASASSGVWPEAAGAAAQADRLSVRLTALAETDQHAYTRARELLQRAVEPDSAATGELEAERRDYELATALHAAAEVPVTIAEAAADTAALAALLAAEALADMRADAVVAATLAEAGAAGAAHLVRVNLAVRPDDELTRRADAAVKTATAARLQAAG
jgi:formiminotetrahydrofolate cyclodeaminase